MALLIRAALLFGIVWCFLVAFAVLPSPWSRTTIRIRNGEIRVSGADIAPRAREHLADVIREAMIFKGFIAISRRGEVRFSRTVPGAMRQRLRNILLN